MNDVSNPSKLGDKVLAAGEQLFVSKSYLYNYYQRLSMLEWMSCYMGMPSVTIFGVHYWPFVRTLPIARYHLVYIAQIFHLEVIVKAGIPTEVIISDTNAVREIRDIFIERISMNIFQLELISHWRTVF